MKDKIFLIWSGDNQIAIKVKAILEGEHNYICYVGGNHTNDSDVTICSDGVNDVINIVSIGKNSHTVYSTSSV